MKPDTRTNVSVSPCLLMGLALVIFFFLKGTAWSGFDLDGMKLPPGFTVTTYVTGAGFDPDRGQNARGIPAIVTLTFDPRGYLWIGSDGPHHTPHRDGSGRIYRAFLSDGELQLVHSGPLPSGMSLSPGGNLFVAQRRSGKIFVLTPEGRRVEFASFTGGSALRTLVFPPVTRETQKAGIAGDLFVVVFLMLDYPAREVIRISGPFDAYVKEASRGR
ncbi:MAG: hypothetical protein ACE5JO_04715 [Candidatus Binatia bacterium]